MNEILARFCSASTDPREYLRTPIRHEGFVYATNGHVAVRVADAEGIEAADAAGAVLRVVDTISKYFSAQYEWQPMPEFDGDPCQKCSGSGQVPATEDEPCDECDGEGEFDHGSHSYECKACDGEGSFSDEVEGVEPCPECHGTCISWEKPHPVGRQHFAKSYLKLFKDTFPCSEIGLGPSEAGAHFGPPASVRSPCGMVGFVMPMSR